MNARGAPERSRFPSPGFAEDDDRVWIRSETTDGRLRNRVSAYARDRCNAAVKRRRAEERGRCRRDGLRIDRRRCLRSPSRRRWRFRDGHDDRPTSIRRHLCALPRPVSRTTTDDCYVGGANDANKRKASRRLPRGLRVHPTLPVHRTAAPCRS